MDVGRRIVGVYDKNLHTHVCQAINLFAVTSSE